MTVILGRFLFRHRNVLFPSAIALTFVPGPEVFSAPLFAAALGAADDVTVTDVYPARETAVPGVTGKLIVDALSDQGVLAGWTPTVEQGVARLQRRGRDGDVFLVLGAGDVDRATGMLT